MRIRVSTRLPLYCAFLLAVAPVFSQQTSIQGTVTDTSGATVATAIVKLAPVNGGPASSTLTNNAGVYLFPAIAAGEYKVRVEAPGFGVLERTVSILVGQGITADFQVKPATSSTTVMVMEDTAAVETTSSQVGGYVDPNRMKNVPLNGRNWMELSLLVPGVTVNAIGNTPLGSVSGGRFQINVDGQQVTQNSAGTGFGQPQYSREAMEQFQVITNRFDATLGRSSQIQVNAQTRSGTNLFHGSAYGYFRTDAVNAADPIAQRVLPFSNQQYGGTFGGPLLHNKLFFFAAFEGERQPGTIFNTPAGFTGTSFSFPTKSQTNSFLSRADWHLNAKHRLSMRYSMFTFSNPFDLSSSSAHPSQAAARTRKSHNALVNWSWVASPSVVNELKYGFNYFNWTNDPMVQSLEMRFPGGITVGGAYNFPQVFNQPVNQIRDDLYLLKGTHSIKVGGEYLSNNHSGLFQQNVRGVATVASAPSNYNTVFPVWNDPSTWRLDAVAPLTSVYTQGFGDFNIDIPRNVVGFWLQDDWKISKRLTLNLGLRYDNDIGVFYTPNLKSGVLAPRGGDNNNISPRAGFAWDMTGSRKTVLRGGAGLYYADIQANQVINQSIFNGERSIQASVQKTATANIDLNKPFGGVSGADFVSGKAIVPLQSLQLIGPGAVTPYSFQASLGAERSFGSDWTFSGDFVYWRVYKEWQRHDNNLFFNPATGFNVNPNTGGRPDPRFSQILYFVTPNAAGAIYYGLQMELQRRFAKRYQTGVAYTVAKLKDSSPGAFNYPNNQFDLADEWAQSADDQRHTVNFNGSIQLKWGFQTSLLYHLGSGAAFAVSSPANPFAYTGGSRTFATGTAVFIAPEFVKPSRAAGYSVAVRNALRGKAIHRVDWRLSKAVAIHEKWRVTGIFEAFNLLNAQNYGSYVTNAGLATYGRPVQNTNLAYAARMLQFAARFDF
ncbi:MAG: TonB-dependent receptor [Acidobacteria bacterium]|nr:TonB-dependent receptor [Acidobacteriota bacterium]